MTPSQKRRAGKLRAMAKLIDTLERQIEAFVDEEVDVDWENDLTWHCEVCDIIHNYVSDIAADMFVGGDGEGKVTKEDLQNLQRDILALGPPKTAVDINETED